MPITFSNVTGDGVTFPAVTTAVSLPDSGTTVTITGTVDPLGAGAQVPITGSPLTMPAAPGSGSIFWNINVDLTTGAATVQQSTSVDPPPTGSGIVVLRQTLVPASTDPALTPESTPDTW